MRKSDRQMLAMFAGIGTLFVGIIVLQGAINTTWSLEVITSNATKLVVGGFLCVLGVILIGASLDILDELTEALQEIYDRFLGSIGR